MSAPPPSHAPILSTSEQHILEHVAPAADTPAASTLSDEQLALTYEVERTVSEIRQHRWHRIALQFPDDMLADGPRVYNRLQSRLAEERSKPRPVSGSNDAVDQISGDLHHTTLSDASDTSSETTVEERLTILGDTSYGACCVDEVAAEHVNADVVVHYGRSCLSPTARLPVVHVFTQRALDCDMLLGAFRQTFTDLSAKVVLMADIPYQEHVETLATMAKQAGYTAICSTTVTHDPSSPLPNRMISSNLAGELGDYSLFHIADPPSSLLLTVSSRVAAVYICPVKDGVATTAETVSRSTTQRLRRRFALVTQLSTAATFGILINTLSVKNYMSALDQIKAAITRAGKKYYTFVVGKLNAAKVANFAEIDGWVVIGCWESSLVESKEFWKPIITPFELELALKPEHERYWTGEWKSDFQSFLRDTEDDNTEGATATETETREGGDSTQANDDDDDDDDQDSEPPVFDIRTGTYVSTSRPMSRPKAPNKKLLRDGDSGSLIKQASGGTLTAQIGGQVSPAAEFLRSKRTWQGLGCDYQIAYEHDEDGKVVGAPMQEGRSGLARGYAVGDEQRT